MLLETNIGFSVEWIPGKQEQRKDYKGLRCYELIDGYIDSIAIVKGPAIGINIIADDEDRTIIGPVMIPELRMFREDGFGGGYYVYFSADSIQKLKETCSQKVKIGH